jgi:hypothetical protein
LPPRMSAASRQNRARRFSTAGISFSKPKTGSATLAVYRPSRSRSPRKSSSSWI